ncbi:MAG: hypothetical protein LBE35_06865 [Clostridiales bacterium]|jgi:YbbR domain-containing protein|nr:hypothetical protein [Clostridiales bacterium]
MDKFLKQFRANFLANLPFKLAALVIAFLVWFIVMNVQDPVTANTITIPLQMRNLEMLTTIPDPVFLENASALNNMTVSIHVNANSRDVAVLNENLVAYADVQTVLHLVGHSDRVPLAVNLEGLTGDSVRLGPQTPSTVTLELDRIETRYFEPEWDEMPHADYGFITLWDEATIEPYEISVTGPSRVLSQIDRLIVEVAAEMYERREHLFMFNRLPVPVNAEGYPVPINRQHVSFGNRVNIYVPVYQLGMVRVLPPDFEGLPYGFGVSSINLSRDSFSVAGLPEHIAALQPISLETLQLNAATDSITQNFNINNYLPQGVFLTDRLDSTTTATVNIEPIVERDFVITREMVNVTGVGSNFQILTDEIVVTISGLEGVMAGITSLGASANLSGLEYGQHEINLSISLPSGAQIVSGTPVLSVQIGVDEPDPQEDPPENGEDPPLENGEENGENEPEEEEIP